MFKISDKTVRFLLNYNYLFWGPLFIGTQCKLTNPSNLDTMIFTHSLTYARWRHWSHAAGVVRVAESL